MKFLYAGVSSSLLLFPVLSANYEGNGVFTYNILDGGFSDEGFGPRIGMSEDGTISGSFVDYINQDVSPFYDVLSMQELLNWVEEDVDLTPPGMINLTKAFGYTLTTTCAKTALLTMLASCRKNLSKCSRTYRSSIFPGLLKVDLGGMV